MAYNKAEALKRLKNPYKYTSRHSQTAEMRILRGHINRINKKSCLPGDFIQNKYHFANKIKDIASIPEIYAYTTYPEKVGKWIRENPKINTFVIKPNHLSRGIGIRILTRTGGKLSDTNGDVLTIQDIIDECSALIKLKRYKGVPSIIIQERIRSHNDFNGSGMADIRMIYYNHQFLFSCIRIPNKKSQGYGNIHRGAGFGFSIDGKYINNDKRFFQSTITNGKVPFWDDMVLAGQQVTKLFGLRFMAVDMTVDDKGQVIIVEGERSPQIHYYLTSLGALWLMNRMHVDPKEMPGTRKRGNKIKKNIIPEIYFRG